MPLPRPSRRKTHNKTTAAKTVVPEYLCSDIATWLYPVSSGCNLILILNWMDFKNNPRNAAWLPINGWFQWIDAKLSSHLICSDNKRQDRWLGSDQPERQPGWALNELGQTDPLFQGNLLNQCTGWVASTV